MARRRPICIFIPRNLVLGGSACHRSRRGGWKLNFVISGQRKSWAPGWTCQLAADQSFGRRPFAKAIVNFQGLPLITFQSFKSGRSQDGGRANTIKEASVTWILETPQPFPRSVWPTGAFCFRGRAARTLEQAAGLSNH